MIRPRSHPLNRRPTRGPARTRQAAAVVEFALLMPFFMALVVGTFEMARGFMIKECLSDAAQKGCRKGALPGKASSDIQSEVDDIMADHGITGYTITILVNGVAADASTATRFDQVGVKVSVPTSQVFWISTYFLSASSVESETVVMMRQG